MAQRKTHKISDFLNVPPTPVHTSAPYSCQMCLPAPHTHMRMWVLTCCVLPFQDLLWWRWQPWIRTTQKQPMGCCVTRSCPRIPRALLPTCLPLTTRLVTSSLWQRASIGRCVFVCARHQWVLQNLSESMLSAVSNGLTACMKLKKHL